ncbi:MAG TPA: thiamine pyrophosphate-dependent enzyme, partial [Burkholderiaceae bacterium]
MSMSTTSRQTQQHFEDEAIPAPAVVAAPVVPPTRRAQDADGLLARYREAGYLVADINPLARPGALALAPRGFVHQARGQDDASVHALELQLRRSYCGGLALNAAHVRNTAQRTWLHETLEADPAPLPEAARLDVYETLFAAERFEHAIAAAYPTHKRFSVEGSESYVLLLRRLLEAAAAGGARQVVIGMPHRGRVNVLANVMGLSSDEIRSLYTESPAPGLAAWDIKEHLGLSRRLHLEAGVLDVLLAHNPSHLEAVTPVIAGMARALQDGAGAASRADVLPLIVHGDASFSGQGIVTETLNLAGTRGYGVGGTVHVVLNNQIGSTVSNRRDARSTLSTADVARAYDVPILHVNGDRPELVVHAAQVAVAFRQRFQADILVDLIGYRRHGHNGHDDPRVTQPAMQRLVRALPSVVQQQRAQLERQGGDWPARL